MHGLVMQGPPIRSSLLLRVVPRTFGPDTFAARLLALALTRGLRNSILVETTLALAAVIAVATLVLSTVSAGVKALASATGIVVNTATSPLNCPTTLSLNDWI